MTLPSGGNSPPISLADLNTEFGYGNNLAAYQGTLVGLGTACKVISAGVVSLSDFYSTNKVVAGGPTGASGNVTVPQYKTITLTAKGGNGGTNGAAGVYSGGPANGTATPAGPGGAGGTSSFTQSSTTFVSSAGGAGGGGASTQQQVTLTNPLLPGGTGPVSGSIIVANVGASGSAGSGGPIYGWTGSTYVYTGNAASGSAGAAGSDSYQWTGEP